MRAFKLALIQLHLTPGCAEDNLERALELTTQAASNGADLILLPEALPFGWMDPAARFAAGEIPDGAQCQAFREKARELGVFLCTGLVERAMDQLFNAAVLIDPAGAVLLHHRKIYELEIAHQLYSQGGRLGIAETIFGTIGLMICADGFAPGQAISRTLALMGAEIILSPCAWAVPPDHDNARTPYGKLWTDNYGVVAKEHSLWVAACSNVGPIQSGAWAGHHCIGCSMIIGPDGAQRLQGGYGPDAEEILYFEVPARPKGNRTGP